MDLDSLNRLKRMLFQFTGYNNTTNYAIFNELPLSSRGIKCIKYFFSCTCDLVGNSM